MHCAVLTRADLERALGLNTHELQTVLVDEELLVEELGDEVGVNERDQEHLCSETQKSASRPALDMGWPCRDMR